MTNQTPITGVQMVHEQPRTESKLKTILLGTPEQREARRENIKKTLSAHPGLWFGKMFFEPGYGLRCTTYAPLGKEISRPLAVSAGFVMEIGKTALYALATQPLATKLGEYFAQ